MTDRFDPDPCEAITTELEAKRLEFSQVSIERDAALDECDTLRSHIENMTHLIPCPFCDGKGGTTIDDPHALEPAAVSACFICEGYHRINATRFVQTLIGDADDLDGAVLASRLTDDEKETL